MFKKTAEPRIQKNYRRTPIAKYYRADKSSGSPSPFRSRQPKTNRRLVLFNIADILLLILLIAGLIYSLILRPNPTIKTDSDQYHSAVVYKSGIAPLFNGFKNSNKLSFDEAGVVKAIQAKFPEIRSARVELPFFSERPVVWLNISAPAFKLTNHQGSYIIDSQGVAVAESNELPSIKSQVTVQDQTDFQIQVGQQVLNSEGVTLINNLLSQLKQSKIPVAALSLPPRAQEMDLKTADQAYYVKFYLGGDSQSQIGQFLAARHQFSKSGKQPNEYLDVRVPGKIFYK